MLAGAELRARPVHVHRRGASTWCLLLGSRGDSESPECGAGRARRKSRACQDAALIALLDASRAAPQCAESSAPNAVVVGSIEAAMAPLTPRAPANRPVFNAVRRTVDELKHQLVAPSV